MIHILDYNDYKLVEFVDPLTIGAFALGTLAFGLYSANQMNTFKAIKLQYLHVYDKNTIKDTKMLMDTMKNNLTKNEIDRLMELVEKIEQNPKIKKLIDSFYDVEDDDFYEIRKKEKELKETFKNNINNIFTTDEYNEFKSILTKIKK